MIISMLLLIFFPSSTARATGLSNPRFEDYMTGHYAFSNPFFSKFTVFYVVLAACLAFIVNTLRVYFSVEDWKKVLCNLAKICKALLLIICLEFIIKYLLHSQLYSDFIVMAFGRGTSTYLNLENRGIFVMMQGLTREGSHFAYSMMLMVMLLYTAGIIENRKNNIWIFISIMAMILSGALMMLICVSTLSGYWLLMMFARNENKTKKRIAIVIMYTALLLLVAVFAVNRLMNSSGYIGTRFMDAVSVLLGVGNKNVAYYASLSHVTSNQSRLFSLYYAFTEWMKRPLFGIGIGTTFAYSSTLLTLAEAGIVTVILLLRFYINVGKRYGVKTKLALIVLMLWIGCNVFSGIQPRIIVAGDIILIMGCYIVLFGIDESNNQSTVLCN